MNRGELYRVHKPGGDPKEYRAFVVGPDEGLKHHSWLMCDNLVSLRKADLTHYVGSLSPAKLAELDRALKMALDLL